MMVFVDTWAWLALAIRNDQFHQAAVEQHQRLVASGRQYVTSDYVLTELITQLYRSLPSQHAEQYVQAIIDAGDTGRYQIEPIDHSRFRAAWDLRRQYSDKQRISFVDLSSFVVMQELGISEVFTGDRHFEQVNLGFRILN